MPRALLLATLCGLLLGCTDRPRALPDTADLRPGQFGSGLDPGVTAVNLAQWAFADSARTYGRPAEAARAAAALDYIAGELYAGPRWSNVSALTKGQLLQGRQELRQALGIPAAAPSQLVVDRLIAAADALQAGNTSAAVRQLGPPAFSIPGDEVLTRLNNIPYLRMANVSTMRAANELFDGNAGGGDWVP